ncbi:MAG: hypothetical protein ABSC38_04895 [Verrucomicrobiia bacterium]
MRTNMKSIQLGRTLEGKCVFSILGAMVVAVMLATPARADTNAVSDALWASVDQLINAAVAAGGGDSASAISDLNTVKDLLNQAKAALASSGFDPVKFGKKIDAANKKLGTLESQLSGLSEKSAVSKLSSAAKSLQKLANYAGAPLLEEVNARSAGFHKAGDVVTMLYAIPAGCTDAHISISETVSGVIDSSSMSPDGTITITMGSTQGSADVHVYGCGCVGECCSRELYNYGGTPAKPVSGLPAGFPQNLTAGTYAMTGSYSIGCISCGCPGDGCYTYCPGGGSLGLLGTFQMTNLKTFSKILVQAFNAAVAAATTPGCSQNVSYSPFAADTFTVTYTVTCTQPGCTGGATTFQFTLQKQ